jgi:hypothetical protein
MQRSISFLPNTGRESTLEKKYDLDFQYHFCKIGTEHHTYTPIWTNDHKWKGYIYIYTHILQETWSLATTICRC